jgi:hypothetical protein
VPEAQKKMWVSAVSPARDEGTRKPRELFLNILNNKGLYRLCFVSYQCRWEESKSLLLITQAALVGTNPHIFQGGKSGSIPSLLFIQ